MRGRLVIGTVTAVAAIWAATAGSAHAGLLTLYYYDDPGFMVWGGQYTALPGEQNRLHVTYDSTTGWLTITDYGAVAIVPFPVPFVGGDGGAALGNCSFHGNTAKCRRLGHSFAGMFFHLGDGNDRIALIGAVPAAVGGDDGNDTLDATASTVTATLAGGAGDDILRGGPQDDDLFGGRGADDLSGGGGDVDRVVQKHDALSWYSTGWAADDETAGIDITVDDVANDGRPGEGDNVRSDVEFLWGTRFDDALVGDGSAESMLGLEGNDALDGAGGDDRLFGHQGDDVVTGGAGRDLVMTEDGNDQLLVRDGEADRYVCGLGTDVVLADPLDAFENFGNPARPNDCEDEQVA